MTSRYERIRQTLEADFQPSHLSLTDESAKHAGHAGAQAGGETHYQIVLISAAFAGLSRLARYRAVHASLAPEFNTGLHALSLSLSTPGETATMIK